ncbi:Hypothetical predicted protein, partial [Paramuricea clavata]
MAESSETSGPSGLNEVRATLLKVAEQISSINSSNSSSPAMSPSNSSSGATLRTNSSSSRTTMPTTSQQQHNSSAILQAIQPNSSTISSAISEHRRLFNFNKSRCSTKGKAASKKKEKQPTCKLKFVCLAATTATAPPSNVKDKTDLCNAGLGDCTLLLDLNESSVYLYEEILKKFPQLAHTGGYELSLYQRGGGVNGGFHAIKPPLTTIRLKDICALAKIYIRPLQTDIPLLDEETQEENNE